MKDLILVATLVIYPFKGQWKRFPPLMKLLQLFHLDNIMTN